MVPRSLDLWYYTPVEMAATNKVITTTMSELVAKATDNENEHLQRHVVCLMDNLKPLQFLYLTKYNLTSIVPIMRSPKQARAIGEQFNNLPPTEQVQMMYAILNKEETRLHAMIRAMFKQIDIILQVRKSLQAREEKLGRVL